MSLYRTVMKKATAERIIDRSKFIVNIIPCESREDAMIFFDKIRKEYRDATHNVPVMAIGDKCQLQWGSDDGEPQATAAAPILHMLVLRSISDVALMVTRYFGGIKLGTGGLVRAYTAVAEDGLEAAILCDVEEQTVLEGVLDYKAFNKLSQRHPGENGGIRNIRYEDKVRFEVVCSEEEKKSWMEIVNGIAMSENWIKSQYSERIKVPKKVHKKPKKIVDKEL